jgi:hypothetical protein
VPLPLALLHALPLAHLAVPAAPMAAPSVPCAPCTLPSASSACDVVHGVPGAIPRAALHTAGRAVLIASGIALAGERDVGKLARYSLGAALAIEVFALTWAWTHRDAPAAVPAT